MENKPTIRPNDTLIGKNSSQIKDILGLWMPQIQNILHKAIDPNQFLQMVAILISGNNQLQQCTIKSIVGSLIQASLMGLDLSPSLGQVYILPFKNKGKYEATFMFGYKGLCTLMYRSGEVKSIYAEVVHEYDDFDFQMGDNPRIDHKWKLNGDRGEMIGVYAVAELKNGEKLRRLIDRDIVLKRHKNKSPAKNSDFSPWNQPENETLMWQKSALKELFKTAPFSLEVQEQIIADHALINPENFDNQGKKLKIDGLNYAVEQQIPAQIEEIKETTKKTAQKTESKKKYQSKAEKQTETVDKKTGEVIEPNENLEKSAFIKEWTDSTPAERLTFYTKIQKEHDLQLYCETEGIERTKVFTDLSVVHQVKVLWICTQANKLNPN